MDLLFLFKYKCIIIMYQKHEFINFVIFVFKYVSSTFLKKELGAMVEKTVANKLRMNHVKKMRMLLSSLQKLC